jgi:hypothetical protein
LKKKKDFLFEFGFWAKFLVWPSRHPHARAAYVAHPAIAAAQRIHGRALRSGAKFDPLSQI